LSKIAILSAVRIKSYGICAGIRGLSVSDPEGVVGGEGEIQAHRLIGVIGRFMPSETAIRP
jgi:hypothetical protein